MVPPAGAFAGHRHLLVSAKRIQERNDKTRLPTDSTWGFAWLINYISTFTTLVPGDVIVTGTPTGAGARFDPPRYLKPGNRSRRYRIRHRSHRV